MESPATVLVVEDEPAIADAVAARLRAEGFAVHVAVDGPSGVAAAAELVPDLVVLDVMLPGFDGLEVCRRVQAQRPVPVLMLTAREDEADTLMGLAVGCRRLPHQAVQHARAGRPGARPAPAGTPGSRAGPRGQRGAAAACSATSRSTGRDGGSAAAATDVHLTPLEFDLLSCLAERPQQVLSRDQLLAQVWDWADASGTRTVDSHVKAVRRKLGAGRDPHRARRRLRGGRLDDRRRARSTRCARSRPSSACSSRHGRRLVLRGLVRAGQPRLAAALHVAGGGAARPGRHPVAGARHDLAAALDDRRGPGDGPRRLQPTGAGDLARRGRRAGPGLQPDGRRPRGRRPRAARAGRQRQSRAAHARSPPCRRSWRTWSTASPSPSPATLQAGAGADRAAGPAGPRAARPVPHRRRHRAAGPPGRRDRRRARGRGRRGRDDRPRRAVRRRRHRRRSAGLGRRRPAAPGAGQPARQRRAAQPARRHGPGQRPLRPGRPAPGGRRRRAGHRTGRPRPGVRPLLPRRTSARHGTAAPASAWPSPGGRSTLHGGRIALAPAGTAPAAGSWSTCPPRPEEAA